MPLDDEDGLTNNEPYVRAQPIKVGNGWKCSRCRKPCYFDGRCGDGPILLCNCNAAEDDQYDNERR